MSRKVRITIMPPSDEIDYWHVRRISQPEGGRARRAKWLPIVALIGLILLFVFAYGNQRAAGAIDNPPRRPVVTRVCGYWARGDRGPVCARWYWYRR